MKTSSLLVLAASIAALVPALATAQPGASVLPRGTVVQLTTMVPLSSVENKQGDEFYLEVANDVSVNGVVVIPRGSPAAGHVYASTNKGGSHSLRANIVAVRVNGTDVPLHGSVTIKGNGAVNSIGLPLGTSATGTTDRDMPIGS